MFIRTLTLPLKSCAFGTYVVPKKDVPEATAAYLLTFDKGSSTLIVEPRTSESSSLTIHVKAIGTIKVTLSVLTNSLTLS